VHEVSLVQALFDQADRAIVPHQSLSVCQVRVRIGELAGVDPELFRTAFEGCRSDRGYRVAELTITVEKAVWLCDACGTSVPDGERLQCPSCDGPPRLAAGGDIVLDRLELEVPDV
jgi:hydrogenase nickel incorporation protein HypA/HybF